MTSETKLVTLDGGCVTIDSLISNTGGQGDVYRVSYRGHPYALKWFNRDTRDVIGSAFYRNIAQLCSTEPPSEKFIWPQIIVTEPNAHDGAQFGYLMEIFPNGYTEMNDYFRADSDPRAVRYKGYNALLTAGMNVAAAMRELHVMLGMSYKDLNPKNFAINPNNGDILVIDNDNVSADGFSNVSGMNGYMAPEIQRSKFRERPNTRTDYYSLAVILYRMFFTDHPMEGRLWHKYPIHDARTEGILYSIHPVFCFDPNDSSNRPDSVYAPNASRRWVSMPVRLRQLFIDAFTKGIDAPGRRPPENAWIRAIADARDKLIRVPMKTSSGKALCEQFVNFEDRKSIPPMCLALNTSSGYKVALYPGKAIYTISINGDVNCYQDTFAGVVYYAERRLGIRNLSGKEWQVKMPNNGSKTVVRPNEEIPIVPGCEFVFQDNGLTGFVQQS